MNNNKKGFIVVSDHLYKSNYDIICNIFKDFRIEHIEYRYWEAPAWYLYGVSEKFRELKEADAVPQYDVVFTRNEDEIYSFEFKEM